MNQPNDLDATYRGFEQGPIRPPSEAYSLLIRITRNCPWNRCTFCPVYKQTRFSLRPPAHVKKDIDAVAQFIEELQTAADDEGRIERHTVNRLRRNSSGLDLKAFHAALNWYAAGMQSVFLQDADSLIIKPSDIIDILKHLKKRLPWIQRITSYARSRTVARISDANLSAFRQAGLNRIHIGLESGADIVLKSVKKGTTQAIQIKAGCKVKKAGMELSEYVMPGLGGRTYSKLHALETAKALNQINPDFIRLRSLAVPNNTPLFEELNAGGFHKCTDRETAQEIFQLIENLDGIQSIVKSDHILNLFEEVEGQLPEDKDQMLHVLQSFLDLTPLMQCYYQVGRRLGLMRQLTDLQDATLFTQIKKICNDNHISPENVDTVIAELMTRFI